MGTPAPNYWTVAPPSTQGAYTTVAGPANLGAQPVVNWQPGLAVAQGTIVTIPTTGTLTPGSGYFVALQATTLPATPPTPFQSTDTLHFSLGPSGTFQQ